MTKRRTLSLRAHAKINLALAVGPPRESDGMHPIATWMAPIDLCDTVTIRLLGSREQNRFEITWAPDALRPTQIDWPIESDLGVRAVRALESETGGLPPLALRVEKRIPVGAGLGGGSSDAASVLLAVRELLALNITDERLVSIALGLGSDVPFFLGEGPALVTGVGEEIERTPAITGAGAIAVLIPPFGCATGAVYRAYDQMERAGFRSDAVATMSRRAVLREADLFNDLASAAERVEPALGETRARVEAASSAIAHITGSGSAIFVLCEDDAEALRVIESARRFVGAVSGMVSGVTQ